MHNSIQNSCVVYVCPRGENIPISLLFYRNFTLSWKKIRCPLKRSTTVNKLISYMFHRSLINTTVKEVLTWLYKVLHPTYTVRWTEANSTSTDCTEHILRSRWQPLNRNTTYFIFTDNSYILEVML